MNKILLQDLDEVFGVKTADMLGKEPKKDPEFELRDQILSKESGMNDYETSELAVGETY
jgi:hypothetical protein